MLKKITIFSLIILASCGRKETNNGNSKNEIPEALQEGSIDLKRYAKWNNNLTEELYQELVNKSPELKSLETEIEEFNPNETQDKFLKYNQKSDNYYRSAENYAKAITDSVTKNKILDLIKKSGEKYSGKTIELNSLLKNIHEKQNSINDYHNILKIVLTIPIIEKYQNENLPTKSEFEKVIENENKLIEKTKKITPKY
jgi:hypothetical protein